MSSTRSLASLPPDAIFNIAGFLNFEAVTQFSCTCKTVYTLLPAWTEKEYSNGSQEPLQVYRKIHRLERRALQLHPPVHLRHVSRLQPLNTLEKVRRINRHVQREEMDRNAYLAVGGFIVLSGVAGFVLLLRKKEMALGLSLWSPTPLFVAANQSMGEKRLTALCGETYRRTERVAKRAWRSSCCQRVRDVSSRVVDVATRAITNRLARLFTALVGHLPI